MPENKAKTVFVSVLGAVSATLVLPWWVLPTVIDVSFAGNDASLPAY